MQICPKCSQQYDDASKICRQCGAILESVVEEPMVEEPVVEEPVVEAEVVERLARPEKASPAVKSKRSWTCSQCRQSVPKNFEVCWNCGTSRQGTAAPVGDASPAEKIPVLEEIPEAEDYRAIDNVISQVADRCPQCGSSQVIPRVRIMDQGQQSTGSLRVVLYGDPDALFFKDRLYGQLTADICGRCGHVELRVENPGELYEHYLQSRGR